MRLKATLFKELIKQGPSIEDGKRVWDIAKRDFLFLTPELAKSFLKLRNHPRYQETVINREIELLKKNKDIIFKEVSEGNFNLVDMGCGNGQKAQVLLQSLCGVNADIRYCPVNVDEYLVNLAMGNIKMSGFDCVKEFQPRLASFNDLDEVATTLRTANYPRNVVLLLGSILASFDIHNYLFTLSNAMFDGDCLIIGNAIRKGERLINLEAYKHPVFSEWFMHLMNALGFQENEVEYDARFNEMRIEMFYKIKKDREVEFNGRKIQFRAGDEILAAILYKFYEKELEEFCKMYFSDVKVFKDADEEYALVLCRK